MYQFDWGHTLCFVPLDNLTNDEEEEQMQTTFIINMTKPVISSGGSTAPSATVATGGRMHGASRSLILQSLY